ncbi:carbonic anhydrase 2-like [Physella acuta]|uniref:carbonic anhydrase 2-like n=1 Tax=Physella acuta TaxID=109671 RepID=UPI0027DCBA56|nr:carbonic anhydrase 2-like [Physella acuta]XP_059162358.1 carbonic anhydrase 2-like [Physella acuta]
MAASLTSSNILLLVLSFLLAGKIRVVKADAATWNYNRSDLGGPDKWSLTYSDCGGVFQSPIDINTSTVLYDPLLQRFNVTDYTSKLDGLDMRLVNKGGHTAEVIYSGNERVYLRGGNLPDDYRLEQFHFHWGSLDRQGSEHAIDSQFAPMELHLVHVQKRLEKSNTSSSHPHGLAVLGFLFQRSDNNNTKLDELLKYFPNITSANNETEIEPFKVSDLLPDDLENLDFYRYEGSLTTPPCSETVIWSVAVDKINISEYQLNIFRSLHNEEDELLVNDYRPVQNLNSRTVTTTRKPSTITDTSTSTKVSVDATTTPKNSGVRVPAGHLVMLVFTVLALRLMSWSRF